MDRERNFEKRGEEKKRQYTKKLYGPVRPAYVSDSGILFC